MMVKGPFVWYVMAAVAALAPTLAAGQARGWEVSFGAGTSFPISALGDEVRTGYNLQGALGYRGSWLPVGVRLDLFYQDFDAVAREPSVHVARGGEWYRQLSALASLIFEVPVSIGPTRPYGLVGAGWLREWHDDITYSGESHATVGLNAGVGLDFPFFGVSGFVEARYTNLLLGDALRTGPPAVHPEVEFTSIPVTIGIRL